MRCCRVLPVLLSAAAVLWAGELQKFTKDTYDDFAKGEARGLSITEKGELRLAPATNKVCDIASPILWAAARDSKGNVYLGGGEGKVWRVGKDGKPAVFFTAKEIEIHALAADSKDNIYAASSPDGKVYRVTPDGTSSVFYDPPDKYIWALQFDRTGALFVGCGGKAAVYRVSVAGTSEKWFASDEQHIIALGLDKDGRPLAGSDPGAYLYRIEGAGKAFVIHDSPLKELKAIAADAQGNIFAVALGETTTTTTTGKTEEKKTSRQTELYRVQPDGYTETIWNGKDTIPFSLTVTPDGRAIVGTGDKGLIYAIRSRDEISTLARLDGAQVTALLSTGADAWAAVTSNLGALWTLSAAKGKEGAWESETLDAKQFAVWGRVRLEGAIPGGARVALSSRSGNTEKPEKTWNDWVKAEAHGNEFALQSAAARYLQVRLTLSQADAKQPVALDRLAVYYTTRNLPPQFTKLTVFDAGYGFQRFQQAEAVTQSTLDSVTIPAAKKDPMDATRKQRVQLQTLPGLRAARWTVSDPNQDAMTFDVFLRAENDPAWKLVAEKTSDFFYTWDTRSYADGYYRLKITATDAPTNPAGQALTASIESDAFAVDNTPPVITVQDVQRPAGGSLSVKFTVSDTLTAIESVEASSDGRTWLPVLPRPHQLGAREQSLTFTLPDAKAIFLRARDEAGNVGAATAK